MLLLHHAHGTKQARMRMATMPRHVCYATTLMNVLYDHHVEEIEKKQCAFVLDDCASLIVDPFASYAMKQPFDSMILSQQPH